MKIEMLGRYINRRTGQIFAVERIILETQHNPVSGSQQRLETSHEFRTTCGIDLNPIDDQDFAFELIQVEGVIHQVEA